MEFEAIYAKLEEALIAWGPSVVAGLAILFFGWVGSKLARALATRLMRRGGVNETLVRFSGSIFYGAAMSLVVIAALGKFGVNTTSFAAVIAAAGLAIGLAFQDSLSNFAAGVLLIVFRPFQAGDYIEAGGVAGTVQEIELFTTVLNTPDNRRVIVPNAQIGKDSITNYSANDLRRVDLVFGISYDDDMREAKRILENLIAGNDRVLSDPKPTIAVSELADSSVNLVCRPWVKTGDYWAVFFELTEEAKRAFDAAGLSIPFPQSDVHLHAVGSDAA